MTTVPTPTPPNYLDDGGAAFAPAGGGTQTGYGEISGAAANFYIGAGATAWNGVAVINVTAISTAAGQTYTLVIQGATTSAFTSPVTLGTIQVAAVGQYLIPLFAYSGGVLYPYLRLQKIASGASPSITLNAFPLPFSGLSSLSLQDATAVFGLAAQNTQQIAASIVAWASGTATGGPNGNGQYPIYDAAGDSVLVPCPAAVNATAAATAKPSVVKAGLQETFDQVITRLGFITHTDYLFGTAAVAGAGQTAITNIAQLEAVYNPFEDYTNLGKINSEQERFQPFNSTNHVFATDRLNLTAVIDASVYAGGYATTISQNSGYLGVTPYGTPQPAGPLNVAPPAGSTINSIPIANLGWSDLSHVQVGQLVNVMYLGTYYVSQINTTNNTVQLTALTTNQFETTAYSNLNIVLPYYACPLAGAVTATGTAVTTFSFSQSLPAGVQVGQVFSWFANGSMQSTADMRVTAINTSTNTITVSTGIIYTTIPAGAVGIFGPPITSGQLWSQEHYDFSGAATPAWAFDWYVHFPTDETGGADTRNVAGVSTSLSTIAALPADTPLGAWPALWFYSAADGDNLGSPDSSEIDVVEGFYEFGYGPWCFNGADHPGSSDPTTQNSEFSLRFLRQGRTSGYTAVNSQVVGLPFSLANGEVRISAFVTPTDVYRYVNGVLLTWHHFEWTSVDHAQMGMDLAVGSLSSYSLLLVLNAASMANMKFGVSRVKVSKI
jgi:hypothetical protein